MADTRDDQLRLFLTQLLKDKFLSPTYTEISLLFKEAVIQDTVEEIVKVVKINYDRAES